MDKPFLNLVSPAGNRRIDLTDQPLTIGRHPQNKLVITDPQASRFHCVIERAPKGLVVKDLDSRNGTKVNAQPIRAAYLSNGDTITIGATHLSLVIPGAPPPAKRSAPAHATTSDADHPLPPHPAMPAPDGDDEGPFDDVEVVDDDDDGLSALEEAARELERQRPLTSAAPETDADRLVDDAFSGEGHQAAVDFGAVSTSSDDEKFLPVLAGSLPDKPFEAYEIALVNCRGQVVHEAEDPDSPRKRKVATSGEAVSVLRYIILICTRARATDIHLEPKQDDYQLRLRIDGNMVDIVRLSKGMGTRLSALVKILCDIDVQFKNIIQEGHFTSYVPGRRIDYRVSFAPAMFGQKLVIRILDATAAPVHTSDLRLPVYMLDEVQRALKLDQGMILVCGPTGSGKTTTLYALLRDVGVDRRNVVTIEDPVEIEIEGVTQVQVDEEKGNSFPALLRSMLRQDPDVMMIGEIRDGETARIAMQAAMTGHLVFSTIHTKDSIGTVFRLLDLGVEPYLVASSLYITISQRLARELCSYCKRAVKPTPDQLRRMGKAGLGCGEIFMPVGCPRCLKTGFAGRRAFFEMLTTNEDFREIILKSPTPRQIEAALKDHYTRLSDTGYQLVAQGITAFDEIDHAVLG